MHPDRSSIASLIYGYRQAKILFTAVTLELFNHTSSPVTVSSICRRLKLDKANAEIFLDSLVGMKFLIKHNARYSNTPVADTYLVKGKDTYLGQNVKYQDLLWNAWGDMEYVLRHKSPRQNLRQLIAGNADFVRDYISGMQEISRRPAMEVAEKVNAAEAGTMLDVGGGSGVYSAALLERYPKLSAVILDLPQTIFWTRKFIARTSVCDRVSFRTGDYHKASFGSECCGLVLMSHITHDEGENDISRLFVKAYNALRKGGTIVVHDFMLDSTKTAPLFSALFSMHMRMYTRNGRVYSVEEYYSLLRKAGFTDLAVKSICPKADNPTMIIIGKK